MRTLSQAFKSFIPSFLKSRETAASTIAPSNTVNRNQQRSALSRPIDQADLDKLAKFKSQLMRDVHHEQANRQRVTKMLLNSMPLAPTHIPDPTALQRLREAKNFNAMFPAVPTHIPLPRAGQNKISNNLSPAPQFKYRPMSTMRETSALGRGPVARNGRKLPSKAVIQRRLSMLNKEMIETKAKITQLDARLARTRDPAGRMQIILDRGQGQASLTRQRMLGVTLRDWARKAVV